MKMSPLLLFDYMKGFYFKLNNENENLKIQLQKAIDGDIMKEYMSAQHKEADNYYSELRKQNEKVQFENGRLKGELDRTISLLNDIRQSKKQSIDTLQVIVLVTLIAYLPIGNLKG